MAWWTQVLGAVSGKKQEEDKPRFTLPERKSLTDQPTQDFMTNPLLQQLINKDLERKRQQQEGQNIQGQVMNRFMNIGGNQSYPGSSQTGARSV